MNERVYTDYQHPIGIMRELTKQGKPFKIEFRKASDGSRRIIQHAILRKQSKSNHDENSAYKLQFIDTANDQLGSCYIPLIMALNDQKIML